MCFNAGANNLVHNLDVQTQPSMHQAQIRFVSFVICIFLEVTSCVKAGLCDCTDFNKTALLKVTFTLVQRPDRVGN